MNVKSIMLAVAMVGAMIAVSTLAANAQTFERLGTYRTGVFDESAAEIGAFDPVSKRLFVTNGLTGTIDVLDIGNPSSPQKLNSIDLSAYGVGANSVDVKNGVVAAAVEANDKQDNGKAVFFDTNGNFLSAVTVGALPDMLIFTPDGKKVLVANEGEPDNDYNVDPEGSVSIIDISGGVANITQNNVKTAGFTAFNGAQLDDSVRVFSPGATVAQDFEPEYIAVSPDSKTAWVALQENNALALIDIDAGTVTSVKGLGFKDHSLPGNGLDPSDKDSGIQIASWPVFGMYQPDALVAFTPNGQTYLLSANEGDARDYDAFSEESRIKNLDLDATAFPNADDLKQDAQLGRLIVTTTLGDDDNDGKYERLFSFGARSFSIWDATGNLVWDSGDAIERKMAEIYPDDFNSNNDENDSFDSRSDNKGPEPEGAAVGFVAGKHLVFVGLERIGGVLMYDVTNPASPQFLDYINNRNFDGDPEADTAGDLGPEGLRFIPAADSPNHLPLLAVMNEISGSTTIYQINAQSDEPRIVEVKGTGNQSVTVSGTPGTVYQVAFAFPDGTREIRYAAMGADGTAVVEIQMAVGTAIEVYQIGADSPSDTHILAQADIPSLNTSFSLSLFW